MMSTDSVTSLLSASGERVAVTAITFAPASRAISTVRRMSRERPECEIAMTRAPPSSSAAAACWMCGSEYAIAGLPSRKSLSWASSATTAEPPEP